MMRRKTMVVFFTKAQPTSRCNARSICLPAILHPSVHKIGEKPSKIRSREASSSSKAETICFSLSGLAGLYICIEDLLNLPFNQQALSQHNNHKWVNELSESLLRYLDICSNTRDAILSMKESVRELQSALRRRKTGEFSIETNVTAYISSRKKMKKEIAKSLASLKQSSKVIKACPPLDRSHHLSVVITVLWNASLITISIFHSLLLFLSVSILKPKPRRSWSLVLKLVQKRVHAANDDGQGENMNELEGVDVALSNVYNSSEDVEVDKIQSANSRLEALGVCIEGFESRLEFFFRCLIHTRVSLLNILSHQSDLINSHSCCEIH